MSGKPVTLDQWLEYIERLHPRQIVMGLERVAQVRRSLHLTPAPSVITVGGTNGKGSACAMLESILCQAGYRVGCYTSPHLLRYNERVRVNRHEASDEQLVSAFAAVDAARGATRLTYFEFGTLAAVWLFAREKVEVAILEVGLGGRLDAVNVFDTDCALVTGIALDHPEYLGPTREHVGHEKAGIFRNGRPAICADDDPPRSLRRHAQAIGARLLVLDADFGYRADKMEWRYWGPHGKRRALPYPALRGVSQLANAAGCLAALDELRDRLPVTMNDIRAGLVQAENPGRFQVLPGRPTVILDVAHNPDAVASLKESLARMDPCRRTLAVFAMLKDKDIPGVVETIRTCIDHWYVAGIDSPRGAAAEDIERMLRAADASASIRRCANIADAYAQACDTAAENDRILVFGSFYTVAGVMRARARLAARQAT